MEYRNLIDGAWTEAVSGRTFPVLDPATDEHLADVPDGGAADAVRAVEAAASAGPAWRARTGLDRGRRLVRMATLMHRDVDRLAELMTREQGKPLAESRGEIAYAAGFLEWFGEEARRVYGRQIPAAAPDKRLFSMRQPVGVCAAVTPWNFPAAMITRKLGPALAAGCTMVVKPAEQTPLSALALGELALEAEIPAGVVNVITGDPPAIADALLAHPALRKISFTGSTAVGRELLAKAAPNVVHTSLELGGHAPCVIFDDADLDRVIESILVCKFRNAGQTCISANRFLVQEGIAAAFIDRMVEVMARLRLGRGTDPDVEIGPLIDDAALAKVRRHVDDAVERGAVVRTGGESVAVDGLAPRFFAPTLLEGTDADMLVSREETFGPVVPVRTFTDEHDAIRMANDTPYGLAAYLFTRDAARLMRVAEALDYGIVSANDGLPSTPEAPFGGMKHSGLGREGGIEGIDAYLEVKYLSWRL